MKNILILTEDDIFKNYFVENKKIYFLEEEHTLKISGNSELEELIDTENKFDLIIVDVDFLQFQRQGKVKKIIEKNGKGILIYRYSYDTIPPFSILDNSLKYATGYFFLQKRSDR